jgi:pimeloyl-ACP methyl ester carboxylesterase
VVVFVHGFGLSALRSWDSFPAALAARGFPTLSIALPYLCERAPRGTRAGAPYASTSAEIALPAYEQAVADIRAGLDWVLTQDGKRADAPVICGVSLGALVAVLAAGVDDRFGGLVTMLGGGDLDVIVFRGHYRTAIPSELRRANVTLENRRRARRAYHEYLARVRRSRAPLDESPDFHFFLFDPLTFASRLRTTPALMLNARFDPIIPRAAARQLWLELGKPTITWFWGTHWTGGPWKPYVVSRVTRFLRGIPAAGPRRPAESWADPLLP